MKALRMALVLVGFTSTFVHAQSLADVAKKEAERRQAIKEPVRSYTNSDLASLPPVTADTAKPGTSPAGSPSGDAAKDADGKDKKDKDKTPVKDQKYWSGRMKELQTQLDRDQSFADALQSRINGLTADFSARDDPAQRAQIGRDRQKALDEQNRLKQAIQDDRKAIADLEDEARKAGVPPGWLRS
jgi:hypothetical protein